MSRQKTLAPLTRLEGPAAALYTGYPVRKTKAQKAAFRAELLAVLKTAGWPAEVETAQGRWMPKSHNVVAGNVKTASLVLTAHYDTPARLPFPNFIAPRNLVATFIYTLLVAALAFVLMFFIIFFSNWLGVPFFVALLVGCGVICLGMVLMMAGPANPHNANDNTSGVMTLVQTALTLPPELRGQVALVFFDNEELGLVGSAHFRAKHGPLKDKLLLNFDCVGDGDTLLFVPSATLRRQKDTAGQLAAAFAPGPGTDDTKTVKIDSFPLTLYPSDQMHFKRAVGVVALRRAPLLGYYLSRIHTGRDTRCDEANILLLAAGNVRLAQALGPPAAAT